MNKVIFDCDNTMGVDKKEIDDGLTILYFLGREDVDLLGITTTFGNGPIEMVYPQTVAMMRDIGREDIPVLLGEGERGQAPTEAARFLVEMADAYPGEITLVATGHMGNIRAACELDSAFTSKLKAITAMGGYLGPLRLGYRDVQELNLSGDPEGSYALLHAGCPVVLFNAQVCLEAPFGWRDMRSLRMWSKGLRATVRRWLTLVTIYTGWGRFFLWDLLPAVWASQPELFDDQQVTIASTVGDLETGSLMVGDQGATITMPEHILDPAGFQAALDDAWARVVLPPDYDPRYWRKT